MIMHRSDQTVAIRALRSAAPYIRMYKGKIFVVKAGGAVFGDPAPTRALIEQIAILHYVGIRVVLVHGGGPQLTEVTEALGVPTRMVQGRRVTDEKSIDVTVDGAQRPDQHAHPRRSAASWTSTRSALSGVDAGLIRAHKRPPVKLAASRARPSTTASSATSTRVDTTVLQQAARQRPDAGGQPAVGRRERACCSTSTPTRWPRPSARRSGPRS